MAANYRQPFDFLANPRRHTLQPGFPELSFFQATIFRSLAKFFIDNQCFYFMKACDFSFFDICQMEIKMK
jgi:hypothetical protein